LTETIKWSLKSDLVDWNVDPRTCCTLWNCSPAPRVTTQGSFSHWKLGNLRTRNLQHSITIVYSSTHRLVLEIHGFESLREDTRILILW